MPKGKRQPDAAPTRLSRALEAAGAAAEEPRLVTTSIRLEPAQWEWLRRQALERAIQSGGGRSDAGAIIRELVAAAMKAKR